jgi:hypothetical protein
MFKFLADVWMIYIITGCLVDQMAGLLGGQLDSKINKIGLVG